MKEGQFPGVGHSVPVSQGICWVDCPQLGELWSPVVSDLSKGPTVWWELSASFAWGLTLWVCSARNGSPQVLGSFKSFLHGQVK